MRRRLLAPWTATLLLATACTLTPMNNADTDPLLWMEEVQGERALGWVRERNAETLAAMQAVPGFEDLRARLMAVLSSHERIPMVVRKGPHLYNFWQDAEHPRGLWRRTSLDEYRKPQPAWETLLDLDALVRAEGENWVWKGAECLGPDYRLCILKLSRGGADATVLREFDLVERRFVPGGFTLAEAKTDLAWLDADTLLVASDFGPGTLTDSGYARTVRRWRRGQAVADAPTLFGAETSDVGVGITVDATPGYERVLIERAIEFFRSHELLLQGDRLVKIDRPDDAVLRFWRDRVLIEPKSDWPLGERTWPRGSLLVGDAAAYLAGRRDHLAAVFTPDAHRSLAGWSTTRDTLVLNVLEDVASRLEEWRWRDGAWQRRAVQAPFPGTLWVAPLHDPQVADDPLAEQMLVGYTDFLSPESVWLATAGSDAREPLKSLPAFFDAGGMRTEQRFATSRDGTRVPYFVVWPRQPRSDGRNPTLLYGYGGFRISMNPAYLGLQGNGWLARGGVFVMANIRGGGEYGPAWHQAALRENRQRAFDDFIAVAEDLVAAGITTPRHLGIEGGSNGGLLVGSVMLQRPDLFGAVVCRVPLLDMRRYHRMLAGASWMAEYGNPDDPADWAFISRYSPYQNLRAGTTLPPVLFATSTRDDRVHPGHARKMAERMRGQGHAVRYYENIEGGHAGAADHAQQALMRALGFTFLWQQLAP